MVDFVLVLVGAFYVFAGVVAARAAATSHMIDRAMAVISGKSPAPTETAQAMWLATASVAILVSGLALMARLELGLCVFIASALAQAAYIYGVAPRVFDVADPPDLVGRFRRLPSSDGACGVGVCARPSAGFERTALCKTCRGVRRDRRICRMDRLADVPAADARLGRCGHDEGGLGNEERRPGHCPNEMLETEHQRQQDHDPIDAAAEPAGIEDYT